MAERAGCTLEVARLVGRELVIDDDELRLRRRVSTALRRCRFGLRVFGTFEALARLRLPRDGHRFDDAGSAGHRRERLEAPLAQHGVAVDGGAFLGHRGDDLVTERFHETAELRKTRGVSDVVNTRDLNADEDRPAKWPARVVRTSDTVNPQTRTVGVIVYVERPYADIRPETKPPLVKGMFAEVVISGRPIHDAIVIPRAAIRDGKVYIADEENRLRIRPVTVQAEQGAKALIAELVSGEIARTLGLPVPEIVFAMLARFHPPVPVQDTPAAGQNPLALHGASVSGSDALRIERSAAARIIS